MEPQEAVTYVRVSSKDQEESGYSPQAQKRLLWDFARQNGFTIAKDFEEAQTAKKSGRDAFNDMIEYVEEHNIKHILVEKTDRLHRNFKDYSIIEELMEEREVTVYLVKEGKAMSKNSSSNEKFLHGIKTLMAKNFIDNLSEEVKKGQAEKLVEGIYPAKAPLGYINAPDPIQTKRNIILVDTHNAALICKIFEHYAYTEASVDQVIERVIKEGFTHNLPAGRKLSRTSVYRMLKNPFYIGKFIWGKKLYENAQHEPLISLETWFNVQNKLGERACKHKIEDVKNLFVYRGLFECGECGRSITAELKKGKYIYYRCTKYKTKCTQKAIRQKDIDAVVHQLLASLRISETGLKYLKLALKESLSVKQATEDQVYKNLATERSTLKSRISKAYEDKLDGKIPEERYAQLSQKWNERLYEIDKDMRNRDKADTDYYDFGVKILELAENAENIYKKGTIEQQRCLMQYLLSNSILIDQTPKFSLKQPFSQIAKHAASTTCPTWLGRKDSNPRMTGPEPAALPLGDSPTTSTIKDQHKKSTEKYEYTQKRAAMHTA